MRPSSTQSCKKNEKIGVLTKSPEGRPKANADDHIGQLVALMESRHQELMQDFQELYDKSHDTFASVVTGLGAELTFHFRSFDAESVFGAKLNRVQEALDAISKDLVGNVEKVEKVEKDKRPLPLTPQVHGWSPSGACTVAEMVGSA